MKPRADDLAAVLLRPERDSFGFPLALERVYGRRAPLALEIGFGGGEALAWWAGRRPEWNFLGFEQPPACIVRAARAACGAGVAHRVRLVRGDARHLLREVVPAGSAVRALMQFPMPWPKQRHAKHRLTDDAFRAGLASALAPGGRFELVTDQESFAREMAESFAGDDAFAPEPVLVDPPRDFRTRYERRWLAEGRRIWRFRAAARAPRPLPPLSRHEAMQSHALNTLPDAASLRALVGRRFAADGLVCEVKEVCGGEDQWLIGLLAADGGFSQLFLARLRARSAGAVLSVSDCARPYPTPAVAWSLRALAGILAEATAQVREAAEPRT